MCSAKVQFWNQQGEHCTVIGIIIAPHVAVTPVVTLNSAKYKLYPFLSIHIDQYDKVEYF